LYEQLNSLKEGQHFNISVIDWKAHPCINIAEIEVFSFNSRCDNTSLELKSISRNADKLLREREEKPL